MKKIVYVMAITIVILSSCASVPTELYDSVTALRARTTRFEPVQTYAQNDFDEGEKNYNEAVRLIEAEEDLKLTPDLLTAAQTSYTTVIEVGMPAYADDLQVEIDALIVTAEELKANIGYKATFDGLQADYSASKDLVVATDYDSALEQLEAVKEDLQALIDLSNEKIAGSKESIEKVTERVNYLESLITEIERLSQGTQE